MPVLIKNFLEKNKRILLVSSVVFALSLINPIVFNHYYGHHEKLSENLYRLQDTDKFGPEYYVHARFLYESYLNLVNGRFETLSVIDPSNPLFSFPHFQYYNVAPSLILGATYFIFHDMINVYIFGLWISSLLCAWGTYLLTKKITNSTQTSLILATVNATAPYSITNLLSRHAYPEYIATALIPLLLFQLLNFVSFINNPKVKHFWFKYFFYASLLTISATIFFLTHNITSLFSVIILGIPTAVFIFAKIKPKIKSLVLLLPAVLITLASVAFYWVPVLLYGSKTNISSTYYLLETGLKWSPWNVVLSLVPTSSPGAVNTELYLQIGFPILLLAFFFFNFKKFYLYIIGLIIFILVCFNVWNFIPDILHSVQFSFRLLSYIPILLIFAAKKLGKIQIIILLVGIVLTSFLFYQRSETIYFAREKTFNTFPVTNDWGFYQNSLYNEPVSPQVTAPQTSKLEIKPYSNNRITIDDVKNPTNKIKAVTYEITLPKKAELSDKSFFQMNITHANKAKPVEEFKILPVQVQNKFYYSLCINNITNFEFFVAGLNLSEKETSSLVVNKYVDTKNVYIDGLYASTCDYTFDHKTNSFVFKIDDDARQVILPVYYSVENKYTGENSKPITPKGGLLYGLHSYTVFDKASLDTDTIRVEFLKNNKFTNLSKLTVFATIAVFLVTTFFLSKEKLKSKFIRKFNSK